MFFPFKPSSEYVSLLPKAHTDHDASECSSDSGLTERHSQLQLASWAMVLVVACTFLNIALSFLPVVLEQRVPDQLITRQNIHLLPRPNQYIGFDKIPRPSPPTPREFTNYPILLSLVDAAAPEVVFEDEIAMRMVRSGMITPDDRKVRATSTMSTIIQFRAVDWGMEICELHVGLPDSLGHSGMLALYRVNSTIPLDPDSLSYNTRPARIAKLTTLPLGNGPTHWHRQLHCAIDDVLTFELGCLSSSESSGDSDCAVEWVQIKESLPAIYLVQRSTV
ncbi:hypothetical protein HYDPIDRAFT_111615 [Hydnomerulius pinastri MD-312]|uniref:Ubiquitin 3 binding protein But2 C-terminal domain-containing protein n=1 Tax=Hydnomerulius pinastri MD-312 TaxID=994086 RepID=A0A0C9WAE8_9AGAM|nr:hypothetical protein HYDPIDRAFT_111615 [Hydnomerulius pinastri MD-312]